MTDKLYYFTCPECGYDSDEAKFLDKYKNNICPLCAGDTGHDVMLRYRDPTSDEYYRLETMKGRGRKSDEKV
jgi:hypothetical protein